MITAEEQDRNLSALCSRESAFKAMLESKLLTDDEFLDYANRMAEYVSRVTGIPIAFLRSPVVDEPLDI